ncbi:DUF397 domain-containing protein [Paractinoplanes maris]|uniref:DUF397 domain-containing protein n=1 Tax=Paractinoplanes maris TaxID=1734446 RepID=UPI0027DF1F00|nr:DUF397 domain-containing protein [Actinoplanes maris]
MNDPTEPGWHTSRRSAGGNCVEIKKEGDQVLMRDSKDRSGPVLAFDLEAFRGLVADLKEDQLSPDGEPAPVKR